MPYKLGDKFIIEIDSRMTNKHGIYYGLKGLQNIVLNDNALDALEKAISDNARDSVPIEDLYSELVEFGQRDPQFKLGESIKYSPSKVRQIAYSLIEKKASGPTNALKFIEIFGEERAAAIFQAYDRDWWDEKYKEQK